jgi:hypothetical protein
LLFLHKSISKIKICFKIIKGGGLIIINNHKNRSNKQV